MHPYLMAMHHHKTDFMALLQMAICCRDGHNNGEGERILYYSHAHLPIIDLRSMTHDVVER